jgi:uncharacterized damage-inducible protein DinB
VSEPKDIERLIADLDDAYSGDPWHGPSLTAVIEDVSPEEAGSTALRPAHTIGEIVAHAAAWKRIVTRRMRGERFSVSPEEDWPSPRDWKAALAELQAAHEELKATARALDPARLDRPLVEGGSTGRAQLHGMVLHDTYHGGQIAVSKRALRGRAP